MSEFGLEVRNKKQEPWLSPSLMEEALPIATDLAKTAGLFMRGRVGLAVTLTSYAFGEAFVLDKPQNALEFVDDLWRGASKGALMKGSLLGLGRLKLGAAGQGVMLGMSGRLVDSGLSRSTYKPALDSKDKRNPLQKVVDSTFNPTAMVSDAVVFVAAHGLLKGIDKATLKKVKVIDEPASFQKKECIFKEVEKGIVSRRPFLSVTTTGATFGFASGTAGEAMREVSDGEQLDAGRIFTSGLKHGALDAIAAIPGGIQADSFVRHEINKRVSRASDAAAATGHRVARETKWYYWENVAKIKPKELGLIVPEEILSSPDWKSGVKAVETLRSSGFQAYFVGGCVRDILLGRTPKDFDVVTNATPEQVEKLFPDGKFAGKNFGVMHANVDGIQIEIATFRADGKYSDSRRPDSVTLLNRLPIQIAMREDAGRRDITFNAMIFDPITRIAYYYFDGPADLIASRIDTVGKPQDRFAEDPSRLLRVATFTSKLGFSPAERVEKAMKKDAKSIHKVPNELWGQEMNKILLSNNPLAGLDLLKRTGILGEMFPELERLDSPEGDQDPRWHPEGNTWTHTRMVVDQLAKFPERTISLMYSGLFHDIGKPDTQIKHADGRITNLQHDRVGAPIAGALGYRVRLTNDQIRELKDNVEKHMAMHTGKMMNKKTIHRYLSLPNIVNLIELQNADSLGRGKCCSPEVTDVEHSPDENFGSLRDFWYEQLNEAKNPTNAAQAIDAKPILDGRQLIDLGFKPGIRLGDIKKAAQLAQFEGEFSDLEGAINWVREKFGLPGEEKPKQ